MKHTVRRLWRPREEEREGRSGGVGVWAEGWSQWREGRRIPEGSEYEDDKGWTRTTIYQVIIEQSEQGT